MPRFVAPIKSRCPQHCCVDQTKFAVGKMVEQASLISGLRIRFCRNVLMAVT